MLDRRKFLKGFSFITLAFAFLPGIFLKNSTSSATTKSESFKPAKNWLYGSSRKGCSTSRVSTSRVAVDCLGSLEDGLDDFLNFRVPTEFK
ncbi:MAG: hypothetical protein AMJ73_02345 [candidate division Zixibacteria bacterium SM1_73]|nr:MAG: hypothetical protein AMJ73_02345 [candidate division Zixibacteria bacterium SM1_73]